MWARAHARAHLFCDQDRQVGVPEWTAQVVWAAARSSDREEGHMRTMNLREDRGFTLIELLVVIVIIGILAAIAIPIFIGQRSKAYDSEAKSDLRELAGAEELYLTDFDSYGLISAIQST